MRGSITSEHGGNIEFWNNNSKFGASAVFEVMVNYETAHGPGQQRSKLVIDCITFAEAPWDAEGNWHGREMKVEPVAEDDMHGSVYFLATHTPIHVKRVKIDNLDTANTIQVEMTYRLLYEQSGLADDVETCLKSELEVMGQ